MAQLDIKVILPTASHTHTVIFLHGRGSTATQFVHDLRFSTDSQGHDLPHHFPSFRWVLPQSKYRACAQSPGSRISQWFDTWDVSRLEVREDLQIEGLRESVASICQIVKSEAEVLGGRFDRVILAGVSQGGATAAHVLINLALEGNASRLGGLMTFCGRMPFPGRSLADTRAVLGLEGPEGDEVVRNTPVLWQHCVDDPLIRIEYGRQLRDAFVRFGAQVTWKEYPEGGHWIQSPDGIEDAVAWLKRDIVGDGTGDV